MKRSPNERHTQTHGSLTDTFWQSHVFFYQKRVNVYLVNVYIYSLLIEKDIYNCGNVSVKLPCVCVCLSFGDIFVFSVRISSFSSYFCVLLVFLLSYWGILFLCVSVHCFYKMYLIFSWLCCYMAQMNPLIGPKLSNKTIILMAREWVSVIYVHENIFFFFFFILLVIVLLFFHCSGWTCLFEV